MPCGNENVVLDVNTSSDSVVNNSNDVGVNSSGNIIISVNL